MKSKVDLLNDDITKSIISLSIPIMGSAFLQVTYILVDLIWIGRLSTDALAAVGCCGFFIWIAEALTLIPKTGLSVGISQAFGRADYNGTRDITRSGFQVSFIIFSLLTMIYFFFDEEIIGIYNLNENTYDLAISYFRIITIGLVFFFLLPTISSVYYAKGNSVTPFKTSLIGILLNIVLDPILIFGIGPFPELGIKGAAIATVLSLAFGVLIYLIVGFKNNEDYIKINYLEKFDKNHIIDIFKLGSPATFQSLIHALVGVKLNSYISNYGSSAIATYTIGSQIESISWMTSDGLSTSLSSIFGQNYGAKKFDRIKEARRKGLIILSFIGILGGCVLFLGKYELFKIFVKKDIETINNGANYLKILSISQVFMAIEIGTTGMLNGLSLTKYPAYNAVILNLARIPLALFLMPILAINGAWWSMSISSILKGIAIIIIYNVLRKKTDGFRNNMDKYTSRVKNIV